jgi:hypothetical protein
VIRVDEVWLAVEPLDMRAGTETALARVVRVLGEARAHYAYLFANRRANRHDDHCRRSANAMSRFFDGFLRALSKSTASLAAGPGLRKFRRRVLYAIDDLESSANARTLR